MTNYYGYRNWAVRVEVHILSGVKASIFNLDTRERHFFSASGVSNHHTYICDYIDFNYRSSTDYYKGFPKLIALSGEDLVMVKELFRRYF